MNPLQEILFYKDMIIRNRNFNGLTENNAIAKPVLIMVEKEKPGLIAEAIKYHTGHGHWDYELSERYWPVQIPLRELGYL